VIELLGDHFYFPGSFVQVFLKTYRTFATNTVKSSA
jgi:hypothetical protein